MIELTETAAGKVKELLEEEGRNDIALKIVFEVQHIKREAELIRHDAGIVQIVERTTPRRQ